MKEVFNKLNDYTLRIDAAQQESSNNGVAKFNGYSRTFNFLSRQVTTVHRDWMSEGRGSDASGTSALSTHVTVESFDDLPSTKEVELMHRKLVELGGTPPALEDVLPETMNKKASLRPAA